MNAFAPITDISQGNMTSKGQVLIPKSVRERVGLRPGAPVVVGVNAVGQAVVLKTDEAQRITETPAQRRQRITAAIDEATGKYDFGGGTTEEIMRELRGARDPS